MQKKEKDHAPIILLVSTTSAWRIDLRSASTSCKRHWRAHWTKVERQRQVHTYCVLEDSGIIMAEEKISTIKG